MTHKSTTTINILPDNVFIEIFNLCRMDEVDHATGTESHRPWKWHRLAHVCRTWRYIMFESSRRLRLELLCTHGTPVKKNLDYLPTFPIVISYQRPYLQDVDRDNLFAALEQRDRVRVVEVYVPDSLLEALATVMQEPFPALTHLRFEPEPFVTMPDLPDTFLGGSVPCLQTIYISGISFPAAPTLLASAHDLVDVDLSDIPPTGYIPPEAMVTALGALPRLKYLTFGFEYGMSYPDPIRLPPITRTVLPALTIFYFDGLFDYFEDFVAQIDAPQLSCLRIEYLDQEVTNFPIPQLCKFVGRSEKLQFRFAELLIQPDTVAIELVQQGRSTFRLLIQEDGIGQVVHQISAMLSNVDRLFVKSESMEGDERLGYDIPWLELFRPFTALKVLSVDEELSFLVLFHISLAPEYVTGDRATEVLPALELLFLENQPVESMEEFVTARQDVGRPVTIINGEEELHERLHMLDGSEWAHVYTASPV
ncbi:hypothetical protein EDB89DRAFT_2232205 [Lactarius sanguifluus]|nr:hypothetical protein EDB89DRAFT_2232205 [Lactarius sanguifluus]